MPMKKDRIAAVCAKGMDSCIKIKNTEQARHFFRNGIGAAMSVPNIARMLNQLETQLTKM